MPDNFSPTGNSEPLTSYRAMFDAEVRQARTELRRPWLALLSSGVIAGVSVGVSVLLLGLLVAMNGEISQSVVMRLLFGGAYAIGFALAILARADLFTEYTTIAILPVLTGDSHVSQLARLWGLVYAGNLLGGAVMALIAISLGPALNLFGHDALVLLAEHLAGHPWWVVLLSASLAGWLMGLLSWLIAGGRDTTSQILFIWLVGVSIGALGLHHSITGGTVLFAGFLADPHLAWTDLAQILFWITLGNAIGGAVFAILIRQGVRMHHGTEHAGDRVAGRERQRSRRPEESPDPSRSDRGRAV